MTDCRSDKTSFGNADKIGGNGEAKMAVYSEEQVAQMIADTIARANSGVVSAAPKTRTFGQQGEKRPQMPAISIASLSAFKASQALLPKPEKTGAGVSTQAQLTAIDVDDKAGTFVIKGKFAKNADGTIIARPSSTGMSTNIAYVKRNFMSKDNTRYFVALSIGLTASQSLDGNTVKLT